MTANSGITGRRIMVKISGRGLVDAGASALIGAEVATDSRLVDRELLAGLADQVAALVEQGVQVALAAGGGNIVNGKTATALGLPRATVDAMGILATAINGFAIASAIQSRLRRPVRIMSGVSIGELAEPFSQGEAGRILAAEGILVLVCGIGQPLIDSDYTTVQRAIQIEADRIVMMKAGTDGLYDADPNTVVGATHIPVTSHDEAIARRLFIVSEAALVLARQFPRPIFIVSCREPRLLAEVVAGKNPGSIIR